MTRLQQYIVNDLLERASTLQSLIEAAWREGLCIDLEVEQSRVELARYGRETISDKRPLPVLRCVVWEEWKYGTIGKEAPDGSSR